MKAVILAGGLGTRISEESEYRPKPMIEIGGKPILWHIMKIYSHHGIKDFIICCGYKGYVIKEYFSNYVLHQSDVTFNMSDGSVKTHKSLTEDWTVTLVDTGEETMTGGRLKLVYDYVKNEDFFGFTYGDGVADIDIQSVIAFHKKHGKKATVTAVTPPGRFGSLEISNGQVSQFIEKPNKGFINGGFFVLSPEVLDLIEHDETVWEQEPLVQLTKEQQLMAYTHDGFWQPMDTLRDKRLLESLWHKDQAPWKLWS